MLHVIAPRRMSKNKLLPFKLLAYLLYRDAQVGTGGCVTVPLGLYATVINASTGMIRQYLTHLFELGYIESLCIERKYNRLYATIKLTIPPTFNKE